MDITIWGLGFRVYRAYAGLGVALKRVIGTVREYLTSRVQGLGGTLKGVIGVM